MTRFLPRSLLGQVMLALAAALLIAQAISATMLYRAASERRELAVTSAASFQLLVGQRRDLRDERRRRARPPSGRPGPVEDEPFIRLPRSIRFSNSETSPLLSGEERNSAREAAITRQLERQGLEVAEIVVTDRSLESDPLVGQLEQTHPVWDQRLRTAPHELLVVGLRQEGTDGWQVARLAVPPPDRGIVRTLVLQTLILFLVLVGLLYFVLRRITRPLAALADRTRRFGSAGAPEEPLIPSGPQDVRRLIEAHNAMQGRIGSMLDEKDVMLGAIGHDLKTPLAALRVRIESVEDEVIEEFEDLGQPVTLAGGARIAAPVHLTWLKRGLRNLVTNALRYAGTAHVSVLREDGMAVLRVEDEGPGIPEDRIHEMLEPFTRGEASRNRETGGSGLGLTLARAVAEQHGGTLTLANRPEGGLRAEIRIPT
jgi:signal transduction histidine kinase